MRVNCVIKCELQPKRLREQLHSNFLPSKRILQTSAEQSGSMLRPKRPTVGLSIVTKEIEHGIGGNPEVQCIFCTRDPFDGGAARIRAHIPGDTRALGITALPT